MAIKLNDRIRLARGSAGITQGELARRLGIAYPTLNKYERGHRVPDAEILGRMVKILGCDPGWLLTGESDRTEGSDASGKVLAARIPVFQKVPEHFPEKVSEEVEGFISLPDVPKGACAFVTKGENMSPRIRDGDYVIFLPDKKVENGDIAAVNNEWGETLLKRYHQKDGDVYLVSDNPEYPAVRFDNTYRILGKVVTVWRRINI